MRDAIISRRSETVTTTTDYVTIRCGKCSSTFERSVHDYSKTFTCRHCGRRCHVDTAIRAAEALPEGVVPLRQSQAAPAPAAANAKPRLA